MFADIVVSDGCLMLSECMDGKYMAVRNRLDGFVLYEFMSGKNNPN